MKKKWFETWFDTPYYHLLYDHRDDTEASLFISNLLDFLKLEKGASIMDLACGKGRHAAKMVDNGYKVTGTDLSENSIKEAIENYGDKAHFEVHDMLKPWKANQFDLVTNLFTSFGYFDNTQDNITVLKNIHYMLKDDGLAVIDFMNTEKVLRELVNEESITKKDLVFHIKRKADEGKIFKYIDFTDSSGVNHSYREEVQQINLEDFYEITDKANLKIIHTFGSYNLTPYNAESSNRLIIICKKG